MELPERGRHEAKEARDLRDKLVAIDGHVSVVKNVAEFPEYRDVLRKLESTKDVVAAEPFIYVEVIASSAARSDVPFSLKGIDPERASRVLGLDALLVVGRSQDLSAAAPPTILLGNKLARELLAKRGDQLTITLPTPGQGEPRKHTFSVAGVFYVGFDEYDERLAFAALPAVQDVLGRGDQVMGIELKVSSVDQAPTIARAIETALGGSPYVTLDWYARNKKLFTTLFGDLRP